jgi:SAM-dependent methyltransferase
VKLELARRLRCPACRREHTFELRVDASDEREVREGTLRCDSCGAEFAVRRGVPELLHDPPEHVLAEAAGLERFAAQMRAEGWDRERVLELPDLEHGYWYVQARSMHQLLTTVPFQPGETVLDVGSNTCWASNHFAARGLRAIALDIATVELQGLYTADWFLEDGRFFERVLGSMEALPLASSSVDYVYCCQVLHHNDAPGLRRTLAEIFRVLRPGGKLLMVNETLKTLRDPRGIHDEGVEQYEGYEHAHWAWRYRWEATRAGFFTEVTEPHYMAFFGDAELAPAPHTPTPRAAARRVGFALRGSGLARRVYLAWLNNMGGGVSMNMIATKPRRYVGRHEGIATPERLLRTAAAGLRVKAARAKRSPGAPPRLPRSPEEAAAAFRRATGETLPDERTPGDPEAGERAATGSRPPAAPSG